MISGLFLREAKKPAYCSRLLVFGCFSGILAHCTPYFPGLRLCIPSALRFFFRFLFNFESRFEGGNPFPDFLFQGCDELEGGASVGSTGGHPDLDAPGRGEEPDGRVFRILEEVGDEGIDSGFAQCTHEQGSVQNNLMNIEALFEKGQNAFAEHGFHFCRHAGHTDNAAVLFFSDQSRCGTAWIVQG